MAGEVTSWNAVQWENAYKWGHYFTIHSEQNISGWTIFYNIQ